MRFYLIFILILFFFACGNTSTPAKITGEFANTTSTDEFEIHYAKNEVATLFLFPCFSCTAEQTKQDFEILDSAYSHGISVVLLNYNFQLTIDSNESEALRIYINEIINYYQLPTENIYFGGYSSGGNIALLLSNYLIEKQNTYQPEGVFVVDPPIDLWNIYQSSLLNIERNFSAPSVQESEMIITILDSISGKKITMPEALKAFSPIINQLHYYNNIDQLTNLKVRLYSEPDSVWWKENRQADFNQTNAYSLQLLVKNYGNSFNYLELIETKNKGYRHNGERHPHSWSIIDVNDLINWINTPK